MSVEAARPAGAGDVARIADLARQLREELASMRGGAVWAAREAAPEPLEDGYAAALARDDAALAVGTIDGTVVGFGAARVEDLRDGTRLGVVTDLFVERDARGVGVGAAVLDLLLATLGAAGVTGVDVPVLPGHRAAKNFFEGAGFTARLLVLHRPGDGPAA